MLELVANVERAGAWLPLLLAAWTLGESLEGGRGPFLAVGWDKTAPWGRAVLRWLPWLAAALAVGAWANPGPAGCWAALLALTWLGLWRWEAVRAKLPERLLGGLLWTGAAAVALAWQGGPAPGREWSAYAAALAGSLATVKLAGRLVGLWLQPFQPPAGPAGGSPQAGQVIGEWERLLLFVVVWQGNTAWTAFLIAAKSVFRIGQLSDREHRQEAEYIVIGTLMSFTLGLMSASASRAWFDHLLRP